MRKNPAKGGQRGGKTLVESAYGASQHLNYQANRNTMKYYGIEVLDFYCPPSLPLSAGLLRRGIPNVLPPRCPPFAGLFRYTRNFDDCHCCATPLFYL